MATIAILLEVDGRTHSKWDALAIADEIIKQHHLNTTPDLGYEHGNPSGIRMPLKNVSRWTWGTYADGTVPVPPVFP
jgi:hypothetical protein